MFKKNKLDDFDAYEKCLNKIFKINEMRDAKLLQVLGNRYLNSWNKMPAKKYYNQAICLIKENQEASKSDKVKIAVAFLEVETNSLDLRKKVFVILKDQFGNPWEDLEKEKNEW